MITMKVKQYTIHELETMRIALNAARAAICQNSIECEDCINNRVCSDLTAAARYCHKAAQERELKYR